MIHIPGIGDPLQRNTQVSVQSYLLENIQGRQDILFDLTTANTERVANATAILSLDDGANGGEGSFVALAMAGAASTARIRSEKVELEAGACYWLSVQTGEVGNRARAELWPATR